MAKIKSTKSKKKPEAPGWLFANITEASKNSSTIYFLYIGFLIYCAFTVFGTPDRYIIFNEKVKMPILNIDVPLIGFMLMAPLVAIFLFVYLQIYLGRLKWLIDLSTNYAPIERGRLYPWMLNFPKDPESGFIKGLQNIIIKISLWGLLPLVLGLFAFWSLKTHDSLICYFVGITLIIGTISTLVFWCRYERVQRKVPKFIKKNIDKVLLTLLMFIFEIVLLFGLIPMSLSGRSFGLDLSDEKLITEPEVEYEGIYWGHFIRAHLEGANLSASILKRADFRYAYFQNADMKTAILEKANLLGANLLRANLLGAKLMEANLRQANLRQANLPYANLTKAYLMEANLRQANLMYANLMEADFFQTDLERADLTGAVLEGANLWEANLNKADLRRVNLREARGLTIEQLSKVKTLFEATLDPNLEKQIREKYPHLLEEPKEEED